MNDSPRPDPECPSNEIALRERLVRVETQLAEAEKALVRQAKEYDRRLHDLNEAAKHTREDHEEALKLAREDQSHYVTQDTHIQFVQGTFAEFLKRYDERHEALRRTNAVMYGLMLTVFLAFLAHIIATGGSF